MTTAQIILIKKSWNHFRGINPMLVGDIFYSKLFFENPSLRKMFPDKMDLQYQKLMDMMSTIVARLDNLETITDEIASMAQRHATYAVRPAHYKLVGRTLLWTLKLGLGNDWTKEAEEAWAVCYYHLAEMMIKKMITVTVPK